MPFDKEEDLKKQARLLDTVNTVAAILLAGNENASFETTLLKSFDVVGRCLDVDRVQIWRNEKINGEQRFILWYEWLSDYGKNRIQVPYGLQFSSNMKKKWEDLFLNGSYINAPLSELPEEDRNFLGYYETKSVVILPMFLESDFWGFFSIHDCRNERTFSDEEIKILRSTGLIISTTVDHNNQVMKVREADERNRIMLDAAPFCVIFWDKDLRLIDCNQESVKMFEMIDKQNFMDNFYLLSPEYQPDGLLSKDKGIELVGDALRNGYSRFEWMHHKVNGEQLPVEVICIRVKYKNEFIVTEYIRDLREQRAMIAEMRKAEIAEESSKAKSDFLAKMSHEIRTPMNAILGITEIQLQDESLPKAVKEALERIYNSADLLLGIINDILDLSKIEAGKLELIPIQYDIASLIHDTVQLNMMRYESKPIEFKLKVDENVPVMLFGDELRIKQILNNLLSNAFKYTQEGSISLVISSESEIDDNVTIIFCISDTGQGMTAEQVRKLGDEYSRFNMEANRKTEGTGLGMNITRNLLRLMNGSIDIESTPNVGSTFTIRIPQKCTDHDTIGKEIAENLMRLNFINEQRIRNLQIKREYMPYGRVLIVDDVETNLYVARGLMASYDLSIDIAMSGFEAIDKIRNKCDYDVIFMDHMMPKMDGIEATKIIRSMGYTNSIVALTANALAGQAEMFLKNGFDDFISKPIDIRQLNMTLNKLIRDKYPPEIVEAARKQKEMIGNKANKTAIDSQLAEFFIRDAKKAAAILGAIYINKCRRADDISMLIINVHAMKSALANVGEKELSSEALILEQAGRDNNMKLILEKLPPFMESLYIVINKFEEKELKTQKDGLGDYSQLKEKLVEIRAACNGFNKKTAKNLLAELKKKEWSAPVEERLGVLAGFLLHSEFDEAIKSIDDYLNKK
ncbi:MAG: response regulator [Treponema sp.]|jgi:signal transduction histidine kinase/DNA-binding NarL/FixJ family response regulator/HPt (histidine-containing phosphotransfer) domain-containing protein|nr:response regulator [Treponema sp.]